jgi:hypothetical protein
VAACCDRELRGVDVGHRSRGGLERRHRRGLLEHERLVEVEQQGAGHAGTVEISP